MLNLVWLVMIVSAVLLAGFNGHLQEVADGAIKGAETAVTLSLGLIGVMAVWLGIMKLAERSGLVQSLSYLLKPVLRLLFPGVPEDHPAMGSMVMNIAANMLGLVNAATPLGLRAMHDLESLNTRPGTATNAMCTFLAINTGSVQLIPITAIAILAAAGSHSPYAIVGTSLLATFFSSVAGIIAVKSLERLPFFAASGESRRNPSQPLPAESTAPAIEPPAPLTPLKWTCLGGFVLLFIWFFILLAFPRARSVTTPIQAQSALIRCVNALSVMAIPFLLAFFPFYGLLRGLKVYEEFVEGAKEGFQVAIRIIPYLVAMLVAISMFRSSGAIDLLTSWLRPVLDFLRFPSELLPMALMRPLSGSGSLAIFSDLVKQFGPDHLIARMAGTLYGSTETTFYVIAVYFGSVNIQRTRHAIPAGLFADAVGIAAAVTICRLVFS
jgi:spore maturation protein SpmA